MIWNLNYAIFSTVKIKILYYFSRPKKIQIHIHTTQMIPIYLNFMTKSCHKFSYNKNCQHTLKIHGLGMY